MDYKLEEQEEDFRREKERLILEEATVFVLDGQTRSEAIASAKELEAERDQAICDGEFIEDAHGAPESFIDIPEQQRIDQNDSQQLEVYHALCEQEGIDPE